MGIAGNAGNAESPGILRATDLVMDYTPGIMGTMAGRTTSIAQPSTGMRHTLGLDHVSLSLGTGETVAVMGPSGSGKSTLLHVLAGILPPTSGTVSFHGRDIGGMPDSKRTALRRKSFGFVFQSGQLLPELPAVENIALPMMMGGVPYDQAVSRAMLWLERMGLRELSTHRPGEMSGGQVQRVAIARALCVEPEIVFADEPTGALDRATGHDVMTMLVQTARDCHATVVVVTHDPSVARFCQRTLMMRDGRIMTPRDPSASACHNPYPDTDARP